LTSTDAMSTFVFVAMMYAGSTRRSGTPLTLKGPVTTMGPFLGSCFRTTTRLPRKRPARRIATVPGVTDERSVVYFSDPRFAALEWTFFAFLTAALTAGMVQRCYKNKGNNNSHAATVHLKQARFKRQEKFAAGILGRAQS